MRTVVHDGDKVHHKDESDTVRNYSDSPSNNSDATTTDVEITHWSSAQPVVVSNTSTSLESEHEMDCNHSGPLPQNQPCQTIS